MQSTPRQTSVDPTILDQIYGIAATLHSAGTFDLPALRALVRHASTIEIQHSAETGSGVSTLLLSHLSNDHTAFTIDSDTGSVDNVLRSSLFRAEQVKWVIGPTQLTMPKHEFRQTFQFVLLDGPHAWPFPDLEYYYLYPHIDVRGILVVDDIQIRTIGRMVDFLKVDAMWNLIEVVQNTAFFRRTAAPIFCPTGDSWWEQKYNI
jgi:hypothetical protein